MAFQELTEVPVNQVADWQDQIKQGIAPFWFSSILHIVTKAEIDIAGLEVVATY